MCDPSARRSSCAAQRPKHPATMTTRTATLKQLVSQSSYPIDEVAIAEAIIVRSMARRAVPDLVFQSAPARPRIRSFRPHAGRSFRLARSERAGAGRHLSMAIGVGSPAMR
jgi:hypothetical protein